mgnify:FL=1
MSINQRTRNKANCVIRAFFLAEAPQHTHPVNVWNGLSLTAQNAVRHDLGLPPLKFKSRYAAPTRSARPHTNTPRRRRKHM